MSAFSYPARPQNAPPAPDFRYEHQADLSDCSTLTNEEESEDDSDSSSSANGEPDGDNDASEARRAHGSDEEEFPPLDLNYDALKHVASYYVSGNHGKCTEITTLPGGSYHEIRLLRFEDDWTCIGRFARDPKQPLSVMESAIAAIELVSKNTDIPVPKVYFVN